MSDFLTLSGIDRDGDEWSVNTASPKGRPLVSLTMYLRGTNVTHDHEPETLVRLAAAILRAGEHAVGPSFLPTVQRLMEAAKRVDE